MGVQSAAAIRRMMTDLGARPALEQGVRVSEDL
jgi:hypothetical protein